MPPRRALVVAAAAVACFGVAFVALGAPLWLTLLAVVALAGAQALAIATGLALYTRYLDRVPWLALWPAVSAVMLSAAILWRTGRVASPAARFVLAYSGVALYLLLLAVLHPSKALVDALFHAHRLEWVRAGNFFFTQPMPDGVAFPYAIALYVVASPWMALTRDHVALLRVVVCTAHVLTGLLLYAAVLHRWNDRLAGALAVVLWSLIPQWFVVVGNANLTGAFAQSIATASLLTAAILAAGPSRLRARRGVVRARLRGIPVARRHVPAAVCRARAAGDRVLVAWRRCRARRRSMDRRHRRRRGHLLGGDVLRALRRGVQVARPRDRPPSGGCGTCLGSRHRQPHARPPRLRQRRGRQPPWKSACAPWAGRLPCCA